MFSLDVGRGAAPSFRSSLIGGLALLLAWSAQVRAEPINRAPVFRIDAIEALQPPQIDVFLTHIEQAAGVVEFNAAKPHLLFVNSEHRYEPLSARRFDQTDKSIEVLLLVQVSSAMEPFMSQLQNGTRDFVDLLPKQAKVGMLTYAKSVLRTYAASGPQEIKANLAQLRATDSAEPNLPAALQASLDRLANSQSFRRVLVVVSDGLTVAGNDGTFLELGERAVKGGIELDTVGVSLPGLNAGFKNLKRLHVQGQGVYLPTEGPDKIQPALKELAEGISGQLVVRYSVPKHFNGKLGIFQIDGGGIKRSTPMRFQLPLYDPTPWPLYIGIAIGAALLLIIVGVVLLKKKGAKKPKATAPSPLQGGMVIKGNDDDGPPTQLGVSRPNDTRPPQPAVIAGVGNVPPDRNDTPQMGAGSYGSKDTQELPPELVSQLGATGAADPLASFREEKAPEPESKGNRWNAAKGPAAPAPKKAPAQGLEKIALPSPTAFIDSHAVPQEGAKEPPQKEVPTANVRPGQPSSEPREAPSEGGLDLPSPTGYFDASELQATIDAGRPPGEMPDNFESFEATESLDEETDSLNEETDSLNEENEPTLLGGGGQPLLTAADIAKAKAEAEAKAQAEKAPEEALRGAVGRPALGGFVVASTQILEINDLTKTQAVGWVVPLSTGTFNTYPLKDGLTIGPTKSADVVISSLGDQGRVRLSGGRWFLDHDQRSVALRDGERFWMGGQEFLFKAAERLGVVEERAEPFLHVIGGPDNGRRINLKEGDRAVVGSHGSCDGLLRGSGVGPRHIVVSVAGGACRLIDLGSKHGLVHGGRRVFTVNLRPGDRVKVGEVELEFRIPRAA